MGTNIFYEGNENILETIMSTFEMQTSTIGEGNECIPGSNRLHTTKQ